MDSRVHISIEVRDLNKAVNFYAKLFQQQPTKVKIDYANFRLENPNLHLALVLNPSRQSEDDLHQSNRHFGIELFDEARLLGWHQETEAKGIQTITEKDVTCCYAVGNKFWAVDPDGHRWEFWVRTNDDAESMTSQSKDPQGETVSACCAPKSACCG